MEPSMQPKIVVPKKLPIVIRKATTKDAPFIFNSWLKSFRESSLVFGVSNTIYFTNQHKLIEKLLKTSEVLVAVNPEDDSQIYAYLVCERIDGIFVLHYAYVKTSFRKLGIGKALLAATDYNPQDLGAYSHTTKQGFHVGKKYNLIYHPYVLFDLKNTNNVDLTKLEIKE